MAGYFVVLFLNMRNIIYIILFVFILVGCISSNDDCDSSINVIPYSKDKIKDLQKKYVGKSLNSFYKEYGKPEKDVGSGIYVLMYLLQDCTPVYVGSTDNKTILYIQ